MAFSLGPKSLKHLMGPPAVHPDLVACVRLAIAVSRQDLTITEPQVRTEAYQRQLVARGVSKTMHSNHLVHSDGYGHAVDLVPFVNGKASWTWPHIYPIAEAMELAADKLGLELIWGGVWDKRLGTYGSTASDMQRECAGYVARRKKLGKSAFIDGPHFELA